MISVFARNLRFCDVNNNYAALFDGTNDYAIRGGVGIIKPNQDFYWSYWIRLNNTTSDGNLRWHFGQAISNNGNEDFIRILYQAATSLNRLEFNFRSSTTTNSMTTYWELHTGANSAITGSVGSTGYWNASNSSIKKNSNGYVHLFFHYKSVAYGQPHGFTDVDCYWNGQLLSVTSKLASGLVTSTGATQTNHGLVVNPVNLSTANVSNAFMDQLVMLNSISLPIFQSVHNISSYTPAQLSNWLYNQGCPRALISDGRYAVWNFENNWDSTPSGGGGAWTPTNGATFTTTHA